MLYTMIKVCGGVILSDSAYRLFPSIFIYSVSIGAHAKSFFEVIFAISEPILTKFGTRIGHENPQLFVGQIFDIAPLADFGGIFQKFCITGIG